MRWLQKFTWDGIGRRISQCLFLLLFFFLFIKTDYTGSDSLEYAVNILFRIDPLLALCTMLAAKAFIALMLPALLVIALSLLLGRSFCGWVCPMGTLLDYSQPLAGLQKRAQNTLFPRLPLLILLIVVAGAAFALPVVGYFDPFSILVRGLALSVYPALNFAATEFFTLTYDQGSDLINTVTEPFYAMLKATVLPIDQKIFLLPLLSGGMLAAVFLLELWQRRFFCRNICPLGAMLGLTARVGLFHGHGGGEECGRCRTCRSVCRMGAIDEKKRISRQSCILCMECREQCPRSLISFGFTAPQQKRSEISLSRRQFVGVLAGCAVLPVFAGVRPLQGSPSPLLIRPPGAIPEREFLSRCVRCGECMQVCIGNALQPTFLEAGFEGIFSPVLVSRIGYCEFNCTLCGQVCPTGAISPLTLAEKHQFKIGRAYFDRNLCLPYAKGIPCIVCEEHCPTPRKAIAFAEARVTNDRGEMVVVQQPFIIDELCIGCGICENKCPVPGKSAVLVTSAGETRGPDSLNHLLRQ